jgi:hypothetical protein
MIALLAITLSLALGLAVHHASYKGSRHDP